MNYNFTALYIIILMLNTFIVKSQNNQGIIEIDNNTPNYEFLKEKLKNVRVVQLGEIGHGDGKTFVKKVELIKFLHEEMGYNIILYESPFRKLELYNRNHPILDSTYYENVANEVFYIWSKMEEGKLLFKYAQKTKMIISGFDTQFIYRKSDSTVIDSLKYVFRQDIELLDLSDDFFITLRDILDDKSKSKETIEDLRKKKFLTQIDFLIKNTTINPDDFWVQYLISIQGYVVDIWNTDNKSKISLGDNYLRDKYMAKLLKWQINTNYADEKIIVWAHSGHIVKEFRSIHPRAPKGLLCGDYISEDTTINSYNISFIYNEGITNEWGEKKEIKRKKSSFEYWLSKNYDEAFIDLSYYKIDKKMGVNGVYTDKNYYYKVHDWKKHFDAFYFIREMTPSHRINKKK